MSSSDIILHNVQNIILINFESSLDHKWTNHFHFDFIQDTIFIAAAPNQWKLTHEFFLN